MVDLVESITGVLLASFLFLHLLLISTVMLGNNLFNLLAKFMEDFYLTHTTMIAILLVLIIHVFLTLRRVSFDLSKQVQLIGHLKDINHLDSRLWLLQVITGLFLFMFIIIHIWSVFVSMPIDVNDISVKLVNIRWAVFNLILVMLAGIHTGIGIYRMGIKWGFIKYRKKGLVLISLLIPVYILIEILNLYSFIKIKS